MHSRSAPCFVTPAPPRSFEGPFFCPTRTICTSFSRICSYLRQIRLGSAPERRGAPMNAVGNPSFSATRRLFRDKGCRTFARGDRNRGGRNASLISTSCTYISIYKLQARHEQILCRTCSRAGAPSVWLISSHIFLRKMLQLLFYLCHCLTGLV